MMVSIILPTVRTGTLADAIEAIVRQTDGNWELIVVPQGDDRQLIQLLDEYSARDSRVRYVHTLKKNASHARNVGIHAARGEIIAFTDDDCEVAPNWIAVMREIIALNPDVGLLGGLVIAPPSGQPWRISSCPSANVIDAKYYPLRDNWRAPDGFYMIGANMCVRRQLAHKAGDYDEALGAGARFGSCEDQDFMLRVEALGAGLMTSTRLIVNHTSGRRYGWQHFIKHQRNYARGRGAWGAKLLLWGHPVMDIWNGKPKLVEHAKMMVTRPHKWLLSLYNDYHSKRANSEYLAHYVLGDDLLSHPRNPPTHPAAMARGLQRAAC